LRGKKRLSALRVRARRVGGRTSLADSKNGEGFTFAARRERMKEGHPGKTTDPFSRAEKDASA